MNFIIAHYPLDSSKSRIFSEKPSALNCQQNLKIDLTEFVGGGCEILLCREFDPINCKNTTFPDQVIALASGNGREDLLFEVVELIDWFPLIEGALRPGIYQVLSRGEFHEIKDNKMLSKIFTEYVPEFNFLTEKLICTNSTIEIRCIQSGALITFVNWLPLTYFDVCCPICGFQVASYELESEYHICEVIEQFCPHFIGIGYWSGESYEPPHLSYLKSAHKFDEQYLYFKTDDIWQRAIVYVPPHNQKISYWNSSSKDLSASADHFFFVDRSNF
jgi:hypothetical protein